MNDMLEILRGHENSECQAETLTHHTVRDHGSSFDSGKGVFTFKTIEDNTVIVFTREVKVLSASVNYDAF